MLKVLIVDDEPNNRLLLADLLRELRGSDLELLTASDGEEALRIVATERLDLVLLDVVLPGLDGAAVCQRMRSMPEVAGTTIVLVTGASRVADEEKLARSGANGILRKPFRPQALFDVVAEALSRESQVPKVGTVEERAASSCCPKEPYCVLRQERFQHLLFNALNAAVCLCVRDGSAAADLLVEISDYLRATVEETRELLPVRVEVERTRQYLAIQKARFSDRLAVSLDVDPGARGVVPAFALVRLVDSEIQEGVLRGAEGGRVAVSVHRETGKWRLSLRTMGASAGPDEERSQERRRMDLALRDLGSPGLEISRSPENENCLAFDVPEVGPRGSNEG